MVRRREWKKVAKKNMKKHYWLLVVLCLFASFIGVEYTMSTAVFHTQLPDNQAETIMTDLVTNQEDIAREEVDKKEEQIKENDTNAYLGRSRGVFSSLVNSYSSGSFMITLADGLQSIVGSGSLYSMILIIGALIVQCFVWLFVKESYLVTSRRIVLESRVYEKVPMRRFLYPFQTKKWLQIAKVMGLKSIYYFLWSLTGIGGVIKKYSYSMVPYIVAENPNVGAREAITLSRKMMKGHKWEYFVTELSFLGWEILNMITLGLSGIFYSNAYKAEFYGEFYTYVRQLSKEKNIEGSQILCDEYLFCKPEQETLHKVYADLLEDVQKELKDYQQEPKGLQAFLAKWFGVLLHPSQDILAYEKHQADLDKLKQSTDILNGNVYPGRMAPVPMLNKVNHTTKLLPTRSYTLLHLILMFFIISFIGWIWEVSLHLITDGEFVNRGTMHGPWLPIYGSGGVLILVLLRRLREKPGLQFFSAVLLCGTVEYFTAWHLEMIHHGQKWWDYSGYFLNLHGRICGEGLLVFGLGGLAIVYLLAPFLDNLLSKANQKVLLIIASLLLVIYIGDKVYSSKYPNSGKGITTVMTQYEKYEEWNNLNI